MLSILVSKYVALYFLSIDWSIIRLIVAALMISCIMHDFN